jgi:iron complex transport system ATP-binding protein
MQRAVLARALAQQPSILLLDEPTAALDLGHQQQVLGLVQELRRTENLTVVSALHDLTMAARFCDQLVLLNGGRVVALGAAELVLTEDAIREHYGASVRVLTLDEGGVAVIPIGPASARSEKAMRR